jgi:DNA-binding YbaB/EbfC family protein
MFKGLGNIAALVKQAQEMQGRVGEMQEQLGRLRVEGSAGGGMITVEASGQLRILAVRIEPSLLESEDREMLEDLLVAATNQALEKARDAAAEEVSKLTGEINIPGLSEALAKICPPTT